MLCPRCQTETEATICPSCSLDFRFYSEVVALRRDVAALRELVRSAPGGKAEALAPVPPDPRYPAESQSAYEARGASTNRLARPGDFLIVIDREQMGLPLRSGDLVIVTQSKQGLREVTARRYRLVNGRHLFAFESTDSRYDMGVEIPDIKGSDFFQIGGVVVAVYRPLM